MLDLTLCDNRKHVLLIYVCAARFTVVIDIAMTRANLSSSDLAVVVDVLRATSTITAAVAGGYRSVLCAATIDQARALRATGRVLAGEQHCVTPGGFDQGNSPADAARPRGDELILATTNGAPTILAAAANAPCVLIGCLLNLAAVVREIHNRLDPSCATIQLVCSGTNGRVALEDVYLAGRLSALLSGPRTDAALVAEALALTFTEPYEALNASEDAVVLRSVGLADDIAYCARESVLELVPSVLSIDGDVGVLGCDDPNAQAQVSNARGLVRAQIGQF